MPPKEVAGSAGIGADGELLASCKELQFLSEQLMTLSNLGRTIDGSGLAYRSASSVDRRIGVIRGIDNYIHLQHLDLSLNSIKDLTLLKGLKHVLKLNLSNNCVANIKCWDSVEEGDVVFPVLTHLVMDSNSLTELRPLPFKSLKVVSFRGNDIKTCQDFMGHESIESLDLSGNQIKTVAGLANLPLLAKLDLSGNHIEDINGLGELPALKEFSLAKNKLQAMEGPWQELASAPLVTLDLSGNLLEEAKPLEVLRRLAKLRHLGLAGNPFMLAGESAVVDVLVCHWRLSTIDGQPVTAELLARAGQVNIAKLVEAREKAKAEEEAAAA